MGFRRINSIGNAVEFAGGDPEDMLKPLYLQEIERIREAGDDCIAILVGEELARYSPDTFDGVPVYMHRTIEDGMILFCTEYFIMRDNITA